MPPMPHPHDPDADFIGRLEMLAIADLRPHFRNDGSHPDEEIAHLRASIREHAIYRNVVIAKDGTLLAGHGVVEAARLEGHTHFPGYRMPYGPEDPRALKLLVGDNHIARLRVQDDAALTALLQELAQENPLALLGTGFDKGALEALIQAPGLGGNGSEGAGTDTEPQVDRAEELREAWGVEIGQLWVCDEHRVICGDCTEKAVVDRLFGGHHYRLLVTSPPYLDLRAYKGPIRDWQSLATGFMTVAVGHRSEPADLVVNLGLVHREGQVVRYWERWLDACAAAGYPLYGWYVWDQLFGMAGEWNGRLAPAHEWLFHFSFGHQSAHKWVPTQGRTDIASRSFRQADGSVAPLTSPATVGQPYKVPDSVLRCYAEQARGIQNAHPAVFPPAFPAFCLETWSEPGAAIYDPFLGSGTTLVAADNLGRRCFGCEIDPGYVAVTLQRWHDHTGIAPRLMEG